MSEYAIEVEMYSRNSILMLLESNQDEAYEIEEELKPGPMKFPRYLLNGPDKAPDLLASFVRDCWHLAGRHIEVKASDFEIEEDRQ